MATESASCLQDFSTTVPSTGGFVCKSSEFPSSMLRVLATGSHGLENICFINSIEKPKGLCVSTVQPNISCSSESKKRQPSSNFNYSSLDNPTMVSTGSSSLLQKSESASCDRQLVDSTLRQGTESPIGENPQISRLDSVRRRYIARGFSKGTAEILSKAWRTKTSKQYQSAWKLWLGWFRSRSLDAFQVSVVDVLEYLSFEFQKNKSYSAINSYR